ncbi:phage holin family protein [Pararobbsia silviterrae]|uniref:Phage holin family protein n=1 Tax=Pararobbsia silviterrae TaxID=1792498 RepID=A0A494Y3F1_9BURK|nr:phage holin family protein [Pararobbsia silviterrae]RKP56538.1 hypothetical protein D7S86_09205 [Pararobbsia silviterrae]
MTNETHASEAQQGPLRRIIGALLGILHTRIELLGIELAEEKDRLLAALFVGLAAMLFATMALIAFTFLIAAAFWDTYRWQALAILCGVYLLIAIVCGLVARRKMLVAPMVFHATLTELEKDRELFKH